MGSFGMQFCTDAELNHVIYNVAGYRQGVLTQDYDFVDKRNTTTVTHLADTLSGNSGCPIFNDDNYAVAINVAEASDASRNYGVIITWEIYNYMLDAGYPN